MPMSQAIPRPGKPASRQVLARIGGGGAATIFPLSRSCLAEARLRAKADAGEGRGGGSLRESCVASGARCNPPKAHRLNSCRNTSFIGWLSLWDGAAGADGLASAGAFGVAGGMLRLWPVRAPLVA